MKLFGNCIWTCTCGNEGDYTHQAAVWTMTVFFLTIAALALGLAIGIPLGLIL